MNTDKPNDGQADSGTPHVLREITPDNITPQERAILAEYWNAELLQGMVPLYEKLSKESEAAAIAQSRERLLAVRNEAKAFEAKLAEWNQGLGERASEALKALQDEFSGLADDILLALNGELPGQEGNEGEEWKDA